MHLIPTGPGYFRTPDGRYEIEAENGQFYVYLASDPDGADNLIRCDSLKDCRSWLDAQYAPRLVLSLDDLTGLAIGSKVYIAKAPAVVFEKISPGVWRERHRARMTYRPRVLDTRLLAHRQVIVVR